MSLRQLTESVSSVPLSCVSKELWDVFFFCSFFSFDGEAKSDAQFVGLCQHHLEDGHEGRCLAEVAVADNVSVDVEALGVGPALDASGYVVESSNNGGRELQSTTAGDLTAVLERRESQRSKVHFMK